MVEHHLIAEGGQLYIPLTEETRGKESPDADNLLLMFVYPEGDVDFCSWPFCDTADKEQLQSALYDEGNMDRVKPGRVYLPDGEYFGKIVNGGFCLEEAR